MSTGTLLAFHIHHDVLAELIEVKAGGLESRRRYILGHKDCEELRLRLMQPIPDGLLPLDVARAALAVESAANRDPYSCISFWDAKKELTRIITQSEAFQRLHAELCHYCPWNGETILAGTVLEGCR